MNRRIPPYAAHVFVCVHDRKGAGKSCADGVGSALKDALKEGSKRRGWQGRVRVSSSGCMGLCAQGPNVMVHPGWAWFSGVTPADVETILDAVARCMKET